MEGGSQAQDHGQAIYAKIRYSVSSTFATGCSISHFLTATVKFKCFSSNDIGLCCFLILALALSLFSMLM